MGAHNERCLPRARDRHRKPGTTKKKDKTIMSKQSDGAQHQRALLNRIWSMVRIDDHGRVRPRASADPGWRRASAQQEPASAGEGDTAPEVGQPPPPGRRHLTAAELRRFLAKINGSDPETECWPWTASTVPGGYGQFAVARHPRQTHRIAYELFVGPIPEGEDIHHDCEVKRCVNPLHLRSLTKSEHVRHHAQKRRAAKAAAAEMAVAA